MGNTVKDRHGLEQPDNFVAGCQVAASAVSAAGPRSPWAGLHQ
jgi:hypothetical protein